MQGDVRRRRAGRRPSPAQVLAARCRQLRGRACRPATASRSPARSRRAARARASIAAGVPLMLFIIFTLLMLQLQSFSRALLVFLTGPLGIAGVAGGAAAAATGRSASSRCWA
ncbi:MAG: hypothetical protein MZW92_45425 [Comamonadaceae bacterium]|nr:hypothetical protein [Comamonadaceae bacterium]